MGSITGLKLVTLILLGILVMAIAVAAVLSQDGRRKSHARPSDPDKLLLGVLGDSDSAAYQDRVSFPASGDRPGGEFHAITLQWPEALVRLRASRIDLGEWAVWGVPPWASMARVRDALQLPWRGPRKETHQNNLAWASGCESLTTGGWRQTQRLVDVMDEQPARWASGVVVIRTGVNNFGKDSDLAALAADPDDQAVKARMSACIEHVRAAVALIHERHPSTRVVLVGIFNNAHWVPYLDRWTSQSEQANVNRGLDHFDDALRAMAAADPRLAFFDDRAWFARHWGERDPETGRAIDQPVRVGEVLTVTNTAGDHPRHAVLANQHAGLVWNLLWSQELVQLLRSRFRIAIDPITEAEIARFVQQALTEVAAPVGDKP